MWTRRELKEKGKTAFKANYWKTVLVSMLIMLTGIGAFSRGGSGSEEAEDTFTASFHLGPFSYNGGHVTGEQMAGNPLIWLLTGLIGLTVGMLALLLVIIVKACLLNPLRVGAQRFMLMNLNREARVAEAAFAFDHGYKNIVTTMFLRDLYTFLWGLLFLVPGLVRYYKYKMVPYILAEHPDLMPEEILRRSTLMMEGQKWKAFLLDLSFLGWEILSGVTAGLLGVFYVRPYRSMTEAALYERLAYGSPDY